MWLMLHVSRCAWLSYMISIVSLILRSNYLQVSTKVTVSDILPSTKAALSFRIPDHKSGKVSEIRLAACQDKKKKQLK